jgi:uncharacterized membrane protein YozB (DUF420 family)
MTGSPEPPHGQSTTTQVAVAKGIVWFGLTVLIASVLVFAAIRFAVDVPNITTGRLPHPDDFEYRYARYPWLAYAHILPGIVYLLLAPLQLWRGFRSRHLRWHRRIGRVAIVSGLLSGSFAIVFGSFQAFGGPLESAAAVIFGTWFIVALTVAYRSIRRRDVRRHRRWMIRAFAVGLAVGTIRAWIGLLSGLGPVDLRDSFAISFWIAFLMHVAAAEVWLAWRPEPSGQDVRTTRSGIAT